MPIQLPPSVAAALAPLDQAANGAPTLPEPPQSQGPLDPNAAPTPPDLGQPPQLSGIDMLANTFFAHVLAKDRAASAISPQPSAPAQQPQPRPAMGSFADKLSGALADASHASDRPGGWLSGVANVMGARRERLAQEQKDAALIAKNQVETLALQRNIYRQDQEMRETSYKQGSSFVDSLRPTHDVRDGVTQDELSSLVKDDSNYLNTHYVRQTAETQVIDGNGKPKVDANGNPVMTPLYSLISRATKDGSPDAHELSPAESEYIKRNIGQDIPAGTKLNVDQYVALTGRAHAVQNTTDMINKSRDEQLSEDQKRQVSTLLQDGNIQHYIAQVPGRPLAGLYQASQNATAHIAVTQQQIDAATKKGDQNAVKQLQGQLQNFQSEKQKVDQMISQGFSTADKEKFNDEMEKERHERAEEKEKQQALQDRNAAKAKQKTYDQAHDAWDDALAKNGQNQDEAAAYLLRTNPKALAALQDEEARSAVVTEREDPLTGQTIRTQKGKSDTFANLIANNRQQAAAVQHLDTVTDPTQRWQQIISAKSLSKDQKIRLFQHYNFSIPTDAQFAQNAR